MPHSRYKIKIFKAVTGRLLLFCCFYFLHPATGGIMDIFGW